MFKLLLILFLLFIFWPIIRFVFFLLGIFGRARRVVQTPYTGRKYSNQQEVNRKPETEGRSFSTKNYKGGEYVDFEEIK